jgi:hypothetical protein
MIHSWVFLATLATAPPAPQEAKVEREIVQTSNDPSYKVTIPRGFVRTAPREEGFSFERSAGSADWERVRVDLIPLGKSLALNQPPPVDDLLRAVKLPESREVKPIRLPWENLEIDGIECRWSHEQIDRAARIAWVPTSPQATAVCVTAPSTLSKELTADLMVLLHSFRGRTLWLTRDEESSLRYYQWPGYVVPVLSGLFMVTWAIFFRGRPTTAHALRLVWHAAVPVAAFVAYFLLTRSAGAREKMGIEAPLYLWFLVIGPLTLFHVVMIAHRIRTAVDLGD